MTSTPQIPDLERGIHPGEFCDTPTLKGLLELFRFCQSNREMGLVTGEPGVGKTTAARHYAAGEPTVHLVTMSPASSGLVAALSRIGNALSAYPATSSGSAWSDAIRTVLAYDPDPHLLLIDEAHFLSDQSVEEVRAIYDTARVGVVFIGSRELRERWNGKRWAQLTSRILLRADLEGPLPEDIQAFCVAAQIEGKQAQTLLIRAASRPGGLRLVRKVADVAIRLAGPGNPVTAEHVKQALASRAETAA